MASKPTRFYRMLAKVIDKLDVPIVAKGAASQTANLIECHDSSANVLFSISAAGVPALSTSAAAVANPALGCLRVAHAIYNFAVDGGAVGAITPVVTAVIPANAILLGGVVNSTTAVTSAGAATLAVGTTAGSSATAILAATAKASLSIDALINAVPVFATPVKMTAAGSINVTVAAAAITAGVVEIFVLFVVPANA